MKKKFDILGLGCTAIDDSLYVTSYPRADGKVEVLQRERHCGGLCATALVAGARLGARCGYAGTLGDNDDSRFVEDTLRRERVDVSHVVRSRRAGPVRSVIIVDENRRTRTIFYETKNCTGAHPARPARETILNTRVLLVDRFGVHGMIRAARIARQNGIPVVADFETSEVPRFRELIKLADHLVISKGFALALTGERTPALAAMELWNRTRAAVVITCGSSGCWYLDCIRIRPKHMAAYRVKTVDTTGCGDVFHGAYATALARGMLLEERVRFASAAAALKSTGQGGQSAIPDLKAVQRLIEEK